MKIKIKNILHKIKFSSSFPHYKYKNKIVKVDNHVSDEINTNKIMIIEEDGHERPLNKEETIKGLSFDIKGKNNLIKLEKPFRFNESYPSRFTIETDNNNIFIRKAGPMSVTINIWCAYGNNQSLFIDEGCTFGGIQFDMIEENSSVRIGKNCMFGACIYCITGDAHSIFSKEDDSFPCNIAKGIEIGNNVWCGKFVTLGKNAKVPDGCIIGLHSVVSSALHIPENSVIGGNPAKLIKSNLRWERTSPSFYIQKKSKTD